jgi:hypothetical protein
MVTLLEFHPLTFRHRVNFDEADFWSDFQYFLISYSLFPARSVRRAYSVISEKEYEITNKK